jgi:NADH-quinone oxidoreductase subunit H
MFADWLASTLHLPAWLVRGVLAPLVYPGLAAVGAVALFVLWLERKIAARIQMRVGPYYVSPRLHGALQLLADGVRFMFQEIIVPVEAERLAFVTAPMLAFIIAVLPLAVIPGGPGIYGFSTPYSMLVAYALLSLVSIIILVMGWSSSNKFALIGAGREVISSVAGEVLLLLSILAAATMYGTLDINVAVNRQLETGIIGLVSNPLAALLFFIAAALITDRIPFDLVLGEQEIVNGPYTEYTGFLYVLSMALDYAKLYTLSLLFTDLFLGGWAPFTGEFTGLITTFVKAVIVMIVAVFMRAVYGRMRVDKMASLFWRKLIPLAFIALVISAAVRVIYL